MSVVNLKFSSRFQAARLVDPCERIDVSVQVVAERNISRVRWHAQFGIMSGAGVRAVKGFNNVAAQKHLVHHFPVKRENLAKCLREFNDLVELGQVVVQVDGQPMKRKLRATA